MAIDRQSIVDNIYGGAANIVPCLYGLPNLTGNVPPQAYDPAGAKDLLDRGRRGPVQARQARRSTRTTPTRSRQNVMTAIAENWKTNIGLTSSRRRSRTSAWQKLYYNDGKSAISFWGAANGPTGDRGYNYFHSKNAYPTGGNGVKGYHYENPKVDQQLGRRARSSTRPSRTRSTRTSAR